MPKPVTQEQTVEAINAVLATMEPPLVIENLNTDALSDKNWSCNNFAPTVLEKVCEITGIDSNHLQSVEFEQGKDLPNEFADASFVNISMLGDPSTLNHNFNILVLGEITYLIQAFVDKQVNIVRRFPNGTFIENWHNLSKNVNWMVSYNALFGLAPDSVVTNPPEETWLSYQYVT